MEKTLTVLFVMIPLVMLGCTWVPLTPEGKKVRVFDAKQTESCKKLGQTTTSVLAKKGIITRDEEKVREELATLARNSAADMGGNIIVPISDIKNGERSFAVYSCSRL
jgi:hypothetical protein